MTANSDIADSLFLGNSSPLLTHLESNTVNKDKKEKRIIKELNDSQGLSMISIESEEIGGLGRFRCDTEPNIGDCRGDVEGEEAPDVKQEPEGPSISLNLADYVRAAFEFDVKHPPSATTQWHSALFNFARLTKAHPEMMNLTGAEVADRVEAIMRTWPGCDPAFDPWDQVFFERGFDDFRADFVHSWDKVRCPFGWDSLERAFSDGT